MRVWILYEDLYNRQDLLMGFKTAEEADFVRLCLDGKPQYQLVDGLTRGSWDAFMLVIYPLEIM